MIDELTDMRATTLVWSVLGGGSISLPFLEQEAYQDVPARFRFHGHVNDSEFVAACVERGVEVFGVVFEAQGWEFPVELSEDGRVLALNELRGDGQRGWLGLREFTASQGPADWPAFAEYFPEGLVNSAGQAVTDLWEECCSRDLAGEPLLGRWVMCPDRDHVCHFMDRNNPVWREYLKAVIRVQIDAGVSGVQLDESETPFGAFGYGGCFCKDCLAGFREHLRQLEPAALPAELAGMELDAFDYAEYLRARGIKPYTAVVTLPLAREFARYNLLAHQRYFAELAAYIKEYGRSKGREVMVAGNFYNGNPEYDPIIDSVDIMVTEMHSTQYAQPWWFRHVLGQARGRDVLIAENPYGGVIPELATAVAQGRCHDRLRCSFYEGAAMGASMTFPYGSWMGSEIEDSFWAPKPLLDEVGGVLAQTDHLRSHTSANEVAVLYPIADANNGEVTGPRWATASAYVEFGAIPEDQRIAYWRVIREIAEAAIPFDSIALPEQGARPNDVTAARLARYKYVLVPDCRTVSAEQDNELRAYAAAGGQVIIVGEYAVNLADDAAGRLAAAGPAVVAATDRQPVDQMVEDRQVILEGVGTDIGVNTVVTPGGGVALHLVNYRYDESRDRMAPWESLGVKLRVPEPITTARLYRPGADPVDVPAVAQDGRVQVEIGRLETYAVVEFLGRPGANGGE
jgi:hypothetical protein